MLAKKIMCFIVVFALFISVFSSSKLTISFANSASQKDVPWGFLQMDGYGGNLTKTDDGIAIEGSGQQALFNYFYSDKFSSVDGFSTTILINNIAKTNSSGVHDTYIGVQFGKEISPSLVFSNIASGMMLVLQPMTAENTFFASMLFNNGSGLTGVNIGAGTLVLAEGGAINITLFKDKTTSAWHLLLNGVDSYVDFSSVSSILNGGVYFGIKAYENVAALASEQAVRLTVNKINTIGLGNHLDLDTSAIIRSSHSNLDANSVAKAIVGGIQLTGTASVSSIFGIKHALGNSIKNLNGFSTSFKIDSLKGYNGVNGVSNSIDFALTTCNATGDSTGGVPAQGTVNSERLDVWDYYNNIVPTARGIEVRLKRTTDLSLNTEVFFIGSDGQFTIPTNVISSKAVAFSNNTVTITIVKKNANYDILLNGFSILTETNASKISAFNATMNSLSTYGATPIYTGSYDSFGTPVVEGNIAVTVTDINGRHIGNDSDFYNNSVHSAPNSADGYTENMRMRETIADFEYGLDKAYDGIDNRAPFYWDSLSPIYSYNKVTPQNADLLQLAATSVANADNCNIWYTLPSINGAKDGYSDVVYDLNAKDKDNFKDFSLYDKLKIVWQGNNPDSGTVNINAAIYDATTNMWYNLGTVYNASDSRTNTAFDMSSLAIYERQNISKIRFRTYATNLGTRTDGTSYQKTSLYNIDIYSSQTLKSNTAIANVEVNSQYLGNVMKGRYGPYSASGFYDKTDKKWKLWYGSGIEEGACGDNIYYIETTDPQKSWSKPLRLIIDDPENILIPYNQTPGYGGDPSVIKINGIYYMYFSKINLHMPDGNWYNTVYLATSTDGINYSLYNQPIVNATEGGVAGYGTGSPSVVYKDNLYYLYYYTQNESPPGCYRRVSSDGFNFGAATFVAAYCCYDVKYVDELGKWIGTYYSVQNEETIPQSARARLAFSDDGIHFINGKTDAQMPLQDNNTSINHNPGLIGDEFGHGYKTMFLTYGVNDLPLTYPDYGFSLQYDLRQLGWSRITLSDWMKMDGFGGNITETDHSVTLIGSGQQELFNYFYAKKIDNLDGFSARIIINNIAKTNFPGYHDMYIGIQLSREASPYLVFSNAAPGMMLVLQPMATANTYYATVLLNNGSGIIGATIGSGNVTIPMGGEVNMKLSKSKTTGAWHLLLNGAESGVDLSAVGSILNGGAYFGVKAYENIAAYASAQSVSLTVVDVPLSVDFGNYNVSSSNIVTGVSPNTKASDFKSNVAVRNGFEMALDKQDNSSVGTGTNVEVSKNQSINYTILVYGDIDGDGRIAVSDLSSIKKHLLMINRLNSIYFSAADISKNGAVSVSDLLAVKKQILGFGIIVQ